MQIREATIDDVYAMARVQVDTKKAVYPAFYPAGILSAMAYEKTAAAWRRSIWEQPIHPGAFSLVAETEAGEVIGVLIAGPEDGSSDPCASEIYVLYVLPVWHGKGVGRALVQAAARRLLKNGMASLLIWVLAENPSRRFYEALGGMQVRKRDMEINGYLLPEVAYIWNDMQVLIS